ncbi:MAG TPA: HD domain-containing phosphohydrolase [Polyangiaceae bacterium]|jgi:response regulator RpfG family c-di-GMP phosphodiesterase|nr:HD domain-containing phosphohydrolase [Polyangiaceae bacterium]
MGPPQKNRLLERLVAEQLVTPEQQEAVLNVIARTGERAEEALLELKAIDELALLKHLATAHKTRFVSTEKLAKAEIDQNTLAKLPRKLAERALVFPVMYDAATSTLSVVMPDPSDMQTLNDVQVASGVKEVRAFVGRPRAIKAAIGKAYLGDIHAFAALDRDAHAQFTSMLDVFERNLVSEESLTMSLAREATTGERVISGNDLEQAGKAAPTRGGGMLDDAYLETLNVLVSLLENSRAELRGHSAHVARLMRRISERIGVSEYLLSAHVVAAYLHDLGKMGAYHLTALNVGEYEGHRTSASKLSTTPLQLFEAVRLPREAAEAVQRMYERYDGQGFPDKLAGKEIPLGARLLSIADTYADLTQNSRNPFRKTLRPVQACEVLTRHRGTIFDPNLVDIFKHAVTGEELKERLLANRRRALIVDPDPEETTVLELRLIEQGFEVQQARSAEQAIKALEKGEFDIVISEMPLGEGTDGFKLLELARKAEWGRALPWVFVTGRAAGNDAQKAFDLGAADFLTKPVSADLLVAKLRQIMDREATRGGSKRGVSGSLSEMGLPDMVQVLWHGRKTGALKIRSQAGSGEIHFVNGNIYNALFGTQRGEEAFYAMLALAQGDFVLDPNFVAPQELFNKSPEALLLEGMRRLDEAQR